MEKSEQVTIDKIDIIPISFRYLPIDVRYCTRSRKHILSKRKQVHTSDIAHSQMQTDAICGKIDIHIKVLTVEVYGNKSA